MVRNNPKLRKKPLFADDLLLNSRNGRLNLWFMRGNPGALSQYKLLQYFGVIALGWLGPDTYRIENHLPGIGQSRQYDEWTIGLKPN